MTNAALVERKLAVLLEHLNRLTQRRPAELGAFRADPLLQDAISMGVLVVVQEALDIALHIASDEGWELASTYRDAFSILAKHGVIDPELAASLGGAVQLRNRIAHGYGSLDVDRLWTELPAGIAAFDTFARAIAAFVGRATP
ncbi:MAG: DUF86 domain-containing protein [Deltaproteobacteria bacterium]|nr:DUF86 domain-containing protein [Deltaproteobacteria bacterium]